MTMMLFLTATINNGHDEKWQTKRAFDRICGIQYSLAYEDISSCFSVAAALDYCCLFVI
jgi:hypothetical protein